MDYDRRYGKCPNCGQTGKDGNHCYRKLDERGFWVQYRVCKSCGTPFDHALQPDIGTDAWREAETRGFSLSKSLWDWEKESEQIDKLRRYY